MTESDDRTVEDWSTRRILELGVLGPKILAVRVYGSDQVRRRTRVLFR